MGGPRRTEVCESESLSGSEDWLFLFMDSKWNFPKIGGNETCPGVPRLGLCYPHSSKSLWPHWEGQAMTTSPTAHMGPRSLCPPLALQPGARSALTLPPRTTGPGWQLSPSPPMSSQSLSSPHTGLQSWPVPGRACLRLAFLPLRDGICRGPHLSSARPSHLGASSIHNRHCLQQDGDAQIPTPSPGFPSEPQIWGLPPEQRWSQKT